MNDIADDLIASEEEIAGALMRLHSSHPRLLVDGVYVIPAEDITVAPCVRITVSLREDRFPQRS